MEYIWKYKTPKEFDDIFMSSDGEFLTGLWFKDSKDALKHPKNMEEKELEIFKETSKWLDIYFKGQNPNFTPKYKINNLTEFKEEVTKIMNEISFGSTITYKEIATKIAENRGISKMSSQAVGQAVGKNPICIIIPCHRVIGVGGKLTGYNGGMKNKIALLELEQNNKINF